MTMVQQIERKKHKINAADLIPNPADVYDQVHAGLEKNEKVLAAIDEKNVEIIKKIEGKKRVAIIAYAKELENSKVISVWDICKHVTEKLKDFAGHSYIAQVLPTTYKDEEQKRRREVGARKEKIKQFRSGSTNGTLTGNAKKVTTPEPPASTSPDLTWMQISKVKDKVIAELREEIKAKDKKIAELQKQIADLKKENKK